jgi:hypothetical protein
MNCNRYRKLVERELERIVKYLVEDRTLVKLLRSFEKQENYNFCNGNQEDSGPSYYSRKHNAWVFRNKCFKLN